MLIKNLTMCLGVKVFCLVFDRNIKEWKNINHFVCRLLFFGKDKKPITKRRKIHKEQKEENVPKIYFHRSAIKKSVSTRADSE